MSPAEPRPVRVVVVDDHPMWREGVARDLTEAGLDVVGTAGDGLQALRVVAATGPDVVVLDLQLPGRSGVEVAAALAADHPRTRVLVLSASGEQADVLAAVKAGASGYLVKSATVAELVAAIRATAAGDAVFTPGLAAMVLGEFRKQEPAPKGTRLTEREVEVLRLVAKGLTAREVAARLVISHRTVENHVRHVLDKLQLRNRLELVRYAVEQGLDDT